MPDKTWAAIEPIPAVDSDHEPIDAPPNKYTHAQLHRGNIALVHPESGAGPSQQNALLVSIEEIRDTTIFAYPEHLVAFRKLRNDSCELAKIAQECA